MCATRAPHPDDGPAVRVYPHAPAHLFMPGAHHMVTAGTRGKVNHFNTPERLNLLQAALFEQAERFAWRLEAWAILANHYHFIAAAPEDASSLPAMLRAIHSISAREVNGLDGTPGRKVWYQYRDTCITDRNPIWPACTTCTAIRRGTESWAMRRTIRGARCHGSLRRENRGECGPC